MLKRGAIAFSAFLLVAAGRVPAAFFWRVDGEILLDQHLHNLGDIEVVEVALRVAVLHHRAVGKAVLAQRLDIHFAAEQHGGGFLKAGNTVDVGEGQTGFGDLVLVPSGGGAKVL